ncbi:glycerophosphodiester phosphodiesterase family protein [Microvirga makkahensis]|uniref:glycerophosphodiester phosphodiesterase family protein n=1 Tax=Microvirga makkahensis TaxID=1128670 RepID=UPI003CCD1A5F
MKPYILPIEQVDRDGDSKPDDLNGIGATDEEERIVGVLSGVVRDVHAAGLQAFTWTMRKRAHAPGLDLQGGSFGECKALYALGVDGTFGDFPDAAVNSREGL